jgi:integrase
LTSTLPSTSIVLQRNGQPGKKGGSEWADQQSRASSGARRLGSRQGRAWSPTSPPRRSELCRAAEGWLLEQLGKARPPGAVATFDEAAAHYVTKHAEKVSLELDIYLLGLVVPFIGSPTLDQVDDEALEPFVKAMHAGKPPATRPLKNKTINLALDRVRRILNLAARSWRENGKPWLPAAPPIITMLARGRAAASAAVLEGAARAPARPAGAPGADGALRPQHRPARRAAVQPALGLGGGCEDLGFSVFVVPRRYVKGRQGGSRHRVQLGRAVDHRVGAGHASGIRLRLLAAGEEAEVRPDRDDEQHGVAEVARRGEAWRLPVHDMRHTVGMRLREAGVSEATRADILWHTREGMTAHYSVAQVLEIRAALELITSERHANNVSLASIIAQQKAARVPAVSPRRGKNGLKRVKRSKPLRYWKSWRARQDLNPRPPGS